MQKDPALTYLCYYILISSTDYHKVFERTFFGDVITLGSNSHHSIFEKFQNSPSYVNAAPPVLWVMMILSIYI